MGLPCFVGIYDSPYFKKGTREMSHAMKEKSLDECYEYSQKDVAEKMFLAVGTVAAVEKRAIEKFKQALETKGITVGDLL